MSALIRITPSGPLIAERDGRVFAPLAQWLAQAGEDIRALVLSPTDDPLLLEGRTGALEVIAIEFPKPTDGRGFSIASLARRRLGWRGELRAIGAVAYDQLAFMARCGFDAFDLREGEDAKACLRAFSEISVTYQHSNDGATIFRRREAALGGGR